MTAAERDAAIRAAERGEDIIADTIRDIIADTIRDIAATWADPLPLDVDARQARAVALERLAQRAWDAVVTAWEVAR